MVVERAADIEVVASEALYPQRNAAESDKLILEKLLKHRKKLSLNWDWYLGEEEKKDG